MMYPGAQWGLPPGALPNPTAMFQHMMMAQAQAAAAAGGGAPPMGIPPFVNAPPGAAVLPAVPAAAPAALPAVTGQKRALEGDAAAAAPPAKHATAHDAPPSIPQQDGPADDAGAAPGAPAATGAGDDEAVGPGDSGDGDELGEADDLADVDDHEEIDEDAIKDVILGQFDKVHRSKAKWRINLKNCIATIGGRDYVLKKVTGEMNFT